jgi:hypothetical protein
MNCIAIREDGMPEDNSAEKFIQRVGYNEEERNLFFEGTHRERHIRQIYKVYRLFSIEAKVVKARHCNSGYKTGDTFILDVDGNF